MNIKTRIQTNLYQAFQPLNFEIGFKFKCQGHLMKVAGYRSGYEDLICEIVESPYSFRGQKWALSSRWLNKFLDCKLDPPTVMEG